MDDLKERLDREVEGVWPRGGGLERTLLRVRRHQRQRRVAAGSLALALTAGVAVSLWSLLPVAHERPSGRRTPVGRPEQVIQIEAGDGSIWVVTCSRCSDQAVTTGTARGSLVRTDMATGRAVSATPIDNPGPLAAGFGSIWMANGWGDTVTRFDSATGKVVATVHLTLPGDRRFGAQNLAVGEGSVWVDTARGAVVRIDPRTNRMTATIRLEPEGPGPLAVGSGVVWVVEGVNGLIRIDPATNQVAARIPIGRQLRRLAVEDVAFGNGLVAVGGRWSNGTVTAVGGKSVIQYGPVQGSAVAWIDPRTNRVIATQSVAGWSGRIVFIDGTFWVSRDGGTVLTVIDVHLGLGKNVPIGDSAFVSGDGVFSTRGDGTIEQVSLSSA